MNTKKIILTGKATVIGQGFIKRGKIMLMSNQIVFLPGILTKILTGIEVLLIPVEVGVEVGDDYLMRRLIPVLSLKARHKNYKIIISRRIEWIKAIKELASYNTECYIPLTGG